MVFLFWSEIFSAARIDELNAGVDRLMSGHSLDIVLGQPRHGPALEDVCIQRPARSLIFPGGPRIPLHLFSDGSRHAIRAEMPGWLAFITAQLRARD
jgi:hypothetical protein